MLNTSFDPNTIPKILRDAGWHVWDGETKRPRIPSPSAPYAKPRQARPFIECARFAKSRGWGIGLQMASAKFVVGIDLDRCIGEDWAEEIIDRAKSGIYLSASGTGLRLFVHGIWPRQRGKEWAHPDNEPHHGFGVYPAGLTRFLTIGPPWREGGVCPNQGFLDWLADSYFPKDAAQQSAVMEDVKKIASNYERCFPDTGVIPHLRESRSRFGKLWRGDWSEYTSQSEADLALANHLCFEYVGPDPERLEKLMTLSGLCRDKWIDRDDYRDWTIDKAIKGYLNSPVFISDLVRARQ